MTDRKKKTQALDLLGDILADTEKQAEDERRKREEAERKKAEEARRKAEAEEQRLREEAQARLKAEEERKKAAEHRREIARAAMADEPDDEKVARPAEAKPAPEEKRSPVVLLAAAIVLVALGVGGYFLYAEMTREYVSPASFARSQPAVVDVSAADSSQEVAFLAKPVVKQPEEETAQPATRRRPTRSRPAEPEKPRGLQLGKGITGR